MISVGLLRGLWWVTTTPLWSPIDEQAHYDVVEAIGRGDGLPIVGQTRVHRDVLTIEKSSPTSPWRSVPVPADPARREWPAVGQSYEAAQPPLYYAVVAPVWRVAHAGGTTASVYALRVASLLLSLLLLPLAWLIGRELFPDAPGVGLGAAAFLAVWSGVNGNFAIVANDGLMAVLAAAVLLVMARAVRRGLSTRGALVTGALVGATVLTKTTGLAIVGVVAIGAVVAAWRNHQRVRDIVRFGAIAGAVAALLIAPWLVFNHAQYGGLTASKQLDKITGSLQSNPPFNLHGMATRLRQAGHGFFDAQILSTHLSHYAVLWFATTAVLGTTALVVLWRRRARHDAAVVAWLFAAWPIAFVTMAFVILHLSGGRSDITGRHLYVALPAVAVALAFASQQALGRYALVALALVAAIGLTIEAHDEPGITRAIYGAPAFANLSPVVDKTFADRTIAGGTFAFSAACPIVATRLFLADGKSRMFPAPDRQTTTHVDVPTTTRLAGTRRGPAHQLFCVTPHSYDARFRQSFRRGHLPLTRAEVAFFPRLWAVVGWGWFLVAAFSITRWGKRKSGPDASRSSSADASSAPSVTP
jgi:hypothetical protein